MGYRPNEVPNQMTQIQAIDPAPAKADDPAESWAQRQQGTNIDVNRLLATDYLSHFNEVIMLIEMLPDMPDMLEDVLAWERKSYQQHFADSEFKDKNLAVEAYDFAPERVLSQFEALVACLMVICGKLRTAFAIPTRRSRARFSPTTSPPRRKNCTALSG